MGRRDTAVRDEAAPWDVTQAAIGNALKAMYDTSLAEPLPPRLAALMQQLAAGETDGVSPPEHTSAKRTAKA